MQKLELIHKRHSLIEELGQPVAPSAQRRLAIQRELSEVNAKLKHINTEDADRAKAEADQRKARGQAEQAQNLARSAVKSPAAATAPVDHRPARADTRMSRGEFLLKNAHQMIRKIESIKNPLPFTTEFYNALIAYVAQQRVHLRDEAKRAALAPGDEPGAWKQTWHGNDTKPPSGSVA